MNPLSSTKKAPGALICIVALLVLSGVLRAGGIGFAVASETKELPEEPAESMGMGAELAPDTKALLEIIKTRTAQLDQKEKELMELSYSLDAAQKLIEQNLTRLAEAEERLQASIANVDGASENDLDRLTAVYESMKPKVAAALFEQMNPEFAAGFIGRMAPQAAANIISGLSSEAGYAISVVLAGRNANAPTE